MLSNQFLRVTSMRQLVRPVARCFSANFTGPRILDDILKKDLMKDKTSTDLADLWYRYHETKTNALGFVLSGEDGKDLLARAASSPFFVQPVFRENGFFMLMSQFQEPSHFLLAYLEDFKMDPSRAQPLLAFSVFDDYASDKDITLIRADILNSAIDNQEGQKIVQSLLDGYSKDDEYKAVDAFNNKPETFDLDDFIARQNAKWKSGPRVDVDN